MSDVKYPSLDQIRAGAHVVVRELRADRELNGRFMLLGLAVGTAAEVLQNPFRGPMLIRARNTLLAIGRDEARQIIVEVSQ
ncbi:ferrous iron transport protein A [Methylocystis sp. WRRC1]|uniref:FeoA family protein n=1 Tax=unclassified Methylocystis TaxID=2625913 RepID=UPI0001F86837|nr:MULTISPECIES: FeoA family protein [unclassified Methylocystis]MCC3246191.1 ferrous iron transport protein A [Methylocystis sp. WRRC1]